MDTWIAWLAAALMLGGLVTGVVVAERSIRRSRGSMLKRSTAERHALSRMVVNLWGYGGGGSD